MVRKIDTFRGESAFGSWFYRIVCNAAYGRRRPQASLGIPLDEVMPAFDEHGRNARLFRDWSASVDDPAVQKQLRDVLTSAIDELPPHYRACIVLRDVEGLSTAEVADALGITVPMAKSRAHRARDSSSANGSSWKSKGPPKPKCRYVHHNPDVRSTFSLGEAYGCT